jgi:hypothetical protein
MFFDELYKLKEEIENKPIKEVEVKDSIRRKDTIGTIKKKTAIGIVEIRDGNGNLLERTNNLVVYDGREFIASKVFNRGDYVDWNITHFGVGKGGTADNQPTTQIGPEDNDTGLYDPHTLNKSSDKYLDDGKLKPIGDENIYLEQDPNTDSHYTRIRIELEIDPALEPDLATPAKINEAGLFYTNSNGKFKLFAHVTFDDKYIGKNDKLHITWYILF